MKKIDASPPGRIRKPNNGTPVTTNVRIRSWFIIQPPRNGESIVIVPAVLVPTSIPTHPSRLDTIRFRTKDQPVFLLDRLAVQRDRMVASRQPEFRQVAIVGEAGIPDCPPGIADRIRSGSEKLVICRTEAPDTTRNSSDR